MKLKKASHEQWPGSWLNCFVKFPFSLASSRFIRCVFWNKKALQNPWKICLSSSKRGRFNREIPRNGSKGDSPCPGFICQGHVIFLPQQLQRGMPPNRDWLVEKNVENAQINSSPEPRKKTLLTFHDTGCLIGIRIMVYYNYYNPHITGQYNPLYALNNPGSFNCSPEVEQCSMVWYPTLGRHSGTRPTFIEKLDGSWLGMIHAYNDDCHAKYRKGTFQVSFFHATRAT